MKAHGILSNNSIYEVKKYVFVILLLIFYGHIYGQLTTQGTDFWVSFGNNATEPYNAIHLQVRVVATKAANVKFTFTETGKTETISLTAGSVYTRDLLTAEKKAVYADATGVSKKSLHIESDENISVFAINLLKYSTDATCILPVNAYDISYYHLSYDTEYEGYIVVAVEDNTKVYNNSILIANLNRGEVYSNYFYNNAKYITANKPVAYFVANICVKVPVDVAACDCFYEQLLPESLWGISFMVPVTIRGIERIRVYAAQNNTTVTHTGGTVMSGSLHLNRGEYVELEIDILDAGCYIESDRPVAVTSYLTGTDYTGLDYPNGDPAMAWIPSIDQFVNEAVIAPFIASGPSILAEHHILIVTSTKDKNLTEMSIGNGTFSSLSGGYWTDHPSDYSFYSMPLTNADLSYEFKNPSGLVILGYGLGNSESYYYLSGSALRKLDASFYVNGVHNQDLESQIFCNGNISVEAVVRYIMHAEPGHLKWFIDDVEKTAFADQLKWSENLSAGTHKISMIVKNEYGVMDTVKTSITNSFPVLTVRDTTVCIGVAASLTVSSKIAASITWFSDAAYSDTIARSSIYETELSGNTVFYIEASSDKGCNERDKMNVAVVTRPVVTATMDNVYLCYGKEITLSVLESEGTVNWNVDHTTVRPLYSQDYIVTASKPFCPDAHDTVKITVGDSLYISPDKLPDYVMNEEYSQQIGTNAQLPEFTLAAGNLPFGLSLSSSGNLSGYLSDNEAISVFTVKVKDEHQCTVTREYTLAGEFDMPKMFSPNNDGINDYFMKGYKVVIFDRLGIEIFKGDDGWDGTYKNKRAPRDIYFYKITREIAGGQTKTYTGYVGLERQ
ncbi:MAG: gliding motility-associated C-terminal domain-containing protein [Prevotellaceae bacterium]|jgi:gliding motility-associated-like protein|nr:gliding motility-associated C-terminal domain-containing protein [Prevotellaceae bacterium]